MARLSPHARPARIDDSQALYFRARRGHLAGPGAPTLADAARTILGAQAQQLPPALRALSMRTAGRPDAVTVRRALEEAPRRLVRTWGQRDTLHLFDKEDWSSIVGASGDWAPGGRGGPLPTARTLRTALARMIRADDPVDRASLEDVAPASYVAAIAERAAGAAMDPKRLAASRLVWCLARRGDACLAPDSGRTGRVVARSVWFPELDWPEESPDARAAATELVRRYLSVHAPATAQDVAHFFGARVSAARAWLAALDDELVPIECGDRTGLVALRDDLPELDRSVPRGAAAWPVRLLPHWESLLMAHADKSWTVPVADERPLVWAKAAMVHPVVLARGRVVATWSARRTRRVLEVTVSPLSGWRAAHAAAVRREAREVAAHLSLGEVTVAVTDA